jgi:hypothetical protein
MGLHETRTRELYSQIVSNRERAWEVTGGNGDQLTGSLLQTSQ